MRTALNEAGIDATWRNIWDDADDAAFVRSVADGNETVPTVRLAGETLIAPRPRDVIARVAGANPDLGIDQRRWSPLRIAQWVTIATLLIGSNALARAGQQTLSWVVDGGAVAAYFAFRSLRSRPRRPNLTRT